MKKYFKWSLIIIAVLIALQVVMAIINPKEDEKIKVDTELTIAEKPELNAEELDKYMKFIAGGPTSFEHNYENGKVKVMYTSVKSVLESNRKGSTLSQASLNQYWDSEKAIEKVLVSEPLRIFKKFSAVNEVYSAVVTKGKTYIVEIERSKVENYLKVDFDELYKDNDLWRERVINRVVYTNNERTKYFDKFGKIEGNNY